MFLFLKAKLSIFARGPIFASILPSKIFRPNHENRFYALEIFHNIEILYLIHSSKVFCSSKKKFRDEKS